MPNKHTLIVAFGQVHGAALARHLGLRPLQWTLVTTAHNLRGKTPHLFDLAFCETARRLASYREIISLAKQRGFDVPTSIHTWGMHAATLSGAMVLMEQVHGELHLGAYTISSSTKGGFSVRYGKRVIMEMRPSGAIRIAKKGGCLL
jgi:hypothetical protein